jgi:hypothetical protein
VTFVFAFCRPIRFSVVPDVVGARDHAIAGDAWLLPAAREGPTVVSVAGAFAAPRRAFGVCMIRLQFHRFGLLPDWAKKDGLRSCNREHHRNDSTDWSA